MAILCPTLGAQYRPGSTDEPALPADWAVEGGTGFFVTEVRTMSRSQRLTMIDREYPELSLVGQGSLPGVSRSSLYYQPAPAREEDLERMALLDRQYLKTPFYGSRRMSAWLRTQGFPVNRKRVRRLMRGMG